jgi:hypothetical protein
MLSEEIGQIKLQTEFYKHKIAPYEENLSLNHSGFNKGKITAYGLLTDEINYQNELSEFNEKRSGLVNKQIELIDNSGALSLFIHNLR